MAKQVKVVGGYEGNDREFYEELAEEYGQYVWEVSDSMAKCDFGVMAVDELCALFDSWGDEFDEFELEDIDKLAVGDSVEFDRGRGSWYEVVAV